MYKIAISLLFFLVFASSAISKDFDPSTFSPTDYALIKRWADIEQAAWPILATNTELCKAHNGYVPGFHAVTSAAGTGMDIYLVGAGSPAESAGLVVGDVITSFNGKDVTHKKKGNKVFGDAYIQATKRQDPIQITYLRDGQLNQAAVSSVPACNVRILYTGLPIMTGFNEDFGGLIIGNQIDLYASNDDDIKLLLARDLAKLFLDHRGEKAKSRRLAGWGASAVGFVTGQPTHADSISSAWANLRHGDRQASEADYLGLYLAARAGVDISHAPAFWETVFANRTGNRGVGRLLGNEPPTPERLEGIRLATQEILAKQAAGAPLIPELPEK